MLLSMKCPAYGVRDQGLPVIIWFDGHFELEIHEVRLLDHSSKRFP